VILPPIQLPTRAPAAVPIGPPIDPIAAPAYPPATDPANCAAPIPAAFWIVLPAISSPVTVSPAPATLPIAVGSSNRPPTLAPAIGVLAIDSCVAAAVAAGIVGANDCGGEKFAARGLDRILFAPGTCTLGAVDGTCTPGLDAIGVGLNRGGIVRIS
jgi:hypothetical protein